MSKPIKPNLEGQPLNEQIRLISAYVDTVTEEIFFRLDHIGADCIPSEEISRIKEKPEL